MTKANQLAGFDPRSPMIRGDDHSLAVTITVTDTADWSAPSTATYVWLQDEPRDGFVQSPLLAVSLSGMSFSTISSGVVATITLPATLTASLNAGSYYHELFLISASGLKATPMTGYVKLTADA